MKIVETISLINDDKVIMGDKDVKLTLETETGRLEINTPAMFTNPRVRLSELQEKLSNLATHMERN